MIKKIKKYTKGTAGFSFVELMVVIALVGILAAIGVPSFLRSLPEKRLKGVTRNLYADLQKARLQAVKQNISVTVSFDTDSGSYTYGGTNVKLADYGAISYGCSATGKNWNDNDIPTSGVTSDIFFRNRGGATQGSIYLQSQNKQDVCYAVTVTAFGAVKIRRFSGSWE